MRYYIKKSKDPMEPYPWHVWSDNDSFYPVAAYSKYHLARREMLRLRAREAEVIRVSSSTATANTAGMTWRAINENWVQLLTTIPHYISAPIVDESPVNITGCTDPNCSYH